MHHVLHSVFSGEYDSTRACTARGFEADYVRDSESAARDRGGASPVCTKHRMESAGGAQVEQRDDAAVHHLEEAQVAASTHRRKTRRKHEASERISNRFPHSPSPFPVMQDNSVQPNTTSALCNLREICYVRCNATKPLKTRR
jgi:hypothetical protein